jgi:hypothetical protein
MHATRYNTGTVTWKHKEAKEYYTQVAKIDYPMPKTNTQMTAKSIATPHI